MPVIFYIIFFFNYTATTEIYTLSLHDALPISSPRGRDHARALPHGARRGQRPGPRPRPRRRRLDRKSTRLNSSHSQISYAVFCLKKKKKMQEDMNVYTHKNHLPKDELQKYKS